MSAPRSFWIAYGGVRGDCGHAHRTRDAAQRCCDRDIRACARLNQSGSLTRAYSDRRPLEQWGTPRDAITVNNGGEVQS